eukprot:gene7416-10108_t
MSTEDKPEVDPKQLSKEETDDFIANPPLMTVDVPSSNKSDDNISIKDITFRHPIFKEKNISYDKLINEILDFTHFDKDAKGSVIIDQLDGIYMGRGPLLVDLLLHGEPTQRTKPITKLENVPMSSLLSKRIASHFSESCCGSNISMSRITRRLLHELKHNIIEEQAKIKYQKLNNQSNEAKSDIDSVNKNNDTISSNHQLPALSFLDYMNEHFIYEVIENPNDFSLSQPVVPAISKTYGQQIGNLLSTTDRTGPPPRGWETIKSKKQRSTLRIYIHQLMLSNHPFISPEERLFIDIKQYYSQYKSLFEQQTFEYLMIRLSSLIKKLQMMVNRFPDLSLLSKDDYSDMRSNYKDLIETIPALNEFTVAVRNMTNIMLQKWQELKSLRQRQGFNNTMADITVFILRSNLSSKSVHNSNQSLTEMAGSNNNRNEELDMAASSLSEPGDKESVKSSEIIWSNLKVQLESIPTMIISIQKKLKKYEINHISSNNPTDNKNDFNNNEDIQDSETPVASSYNPSVSTLNDLYQKELLSINDSIHELVANDGILPKYLMRLSNDVNITPDNQVPLFEQRRRQYINMMKFFINIKVDKQYITSLHNLRLSNNSDSIIDIRKFIEFQLQYKPKEIMIEIGLNRSAGNGSNFNQQNNINNLFCGLFGPNDVLLATIPIALPDHAKGNHRNNNNNSVNNNDNSSTIVNKNRNIAHSFTPSSAWYNFSSSNLVYGGNIDGRPENKIEGSILCSSEYEAYSVTNNMNMRNNATYEGVNAEDLALIPLEKHSNDDIIKQFNSGMSSGNALVDFTRENDFQLLLPQISDLDLNDPRNERLLHTVAKRLTVTNTPIFQLSGLDFSEGFLPSYLRDSNNGYNNYLNYLKFKESLRMKLLKLRLIKPFLFNKAIPYDDNEIRNDLLFKKLLYEEKDILGIFSYVDGINDGTNDDSNNMKNKYNTDNAFALESKNKTKEMTFLEKIRNSRIIQSRNKHIKSYHTSTVVKEIDYLYMEPLQAIDAIFERKRSLKPKPKPRQVENMSINSCSLLIQVMGAKNIPLREEFDLSSEPLLLSPQKSNKNKSKSKTGNDLLNTEPSQTSNTGGTGNGPPQISDHMLDERKFNEKKRARSFVQISFQQNVVSTICYEGATPLWKQSFRIPFQAPDDDYSPLKILSMSDEVFFTLFDEVVEDDSAKGGFLEGESSIRIERRYLGSFSLPISTIYREGRIEGLFRMETPAVNFGYTSETDHFQARQADSSALFIDREGEDNNQSNTVQVTCDNCCYYPTDINSCLLLGNIWFMATANFLTQTQKILLPPTQPSAVDESLNYRASYLHPQTKTELNYFASDDKSTYIKLLIMLDPVIPSTEVIQQDISIQNVIRDDKPYAIYARKWLTSLLESNPHTRSRRYRVFGTDSTGLNVLICRYLVPQKPPPTFTSRRSCVHLVSCIPFMNDSESFLGETDLWCTTKEFWEIGAGDEEEHAIMLYNFLYYLKLSELSHVNKNNINLSNPPLDYISKESIFLVIGRAIPEGDTVYILIKDERRKSSSYIADNYLLINPCNGFIYSALDPTCPLRDIYCLVTQYNLWGNIQIESRPCKLLYDVTNLENWKPFFTSRMSVPSTGLRSIQEDVLYEEVDPSYVLKVEKSLRDELKRQIRKWRTKRFVRTSATTFHPESCNVIEEVLPKLEEWRKNAPLSENANMNININNNRNSRGNLSLDHINDDNGNSHLYGKQAVEQEVKEKMKKILRSYTLRGSTIHQPFTDITAIVEKVHKLCVHESLHLEVKFIVSVRAFPLFNNIISLWVFIGTLESITK